MAQAGKVFTDPLFVGLTRPPMLFGVSYHFFMINAFFGMIGYILLEDFRVLAMMFPVHGIGYYLCSKEPLFIELFMIKSSKCNRSSNKMQHGANSYDPY